MTGVIHLVNRDHRSLTLIDTALHKTTDIGPDEAYIRSLVAHEATHLLDLYTTAWGIEYVYRKNLAYKNSETKNADDSLRVFMLNTSEIESHTELMGKKKIDRLTDSTHITHALHFDENHGPIIKINYMVGNSIVYEVPLTMLSVLEAHATANEYLSRLNDSKSHKGHLVEAQRIERQFFELLNNPELSEYSILLFVLHKHFEEWLELENILRLASAIATLTLDASSIFCAKFGARIKDSFMNKEFGYDLCADLSRGMSRQTIFFKIALWLYSWINNLDEKEKQKYIGGLRANPAKGLNEFLKLIDIKNIAADFEYGATLQELEKIAKDSDHSYAKELFDKNKSIMEERCLGDCLNDVHLPSILLDDDSEASPRLKLNHNQIETVYNNIDPYVEMEKIYRETIHYKFCPPLGFGIHFFNKNQSPVRL